MLLSKWTDEEGKGIVNQSQTEGSDMPVERDSLAYKHPYDKAKAIVSEKVFDSDCNHVMSSVDIDNVSRSVWFDKKKNKLFLFAPVGRE